MGGWPQFIDSAKSTISVFLDFVGSMLVDVWQKKVVRNVCDREEGDDEDDVLLKLRCTFSGVGCDFSSEMNELW